MKCIDSTFTPTNKAFIQRIINIGVHFAKTFIAQQPEDLMIWANSWCESMDFTNDTV